jgi:hypothetical protein
MKKRLLLLIALFFTVTLAACGSAEDTSDSDANANEEAAEETAANEAESSDENEEAEEGETMTSEENEGNEAKVGDTITSDVGEATLVSRTDDVGTFESGPIELTIEKANGAAMKVSDEYVDMFDGQEELEYIQLDMTVENTSEDHITFYASQAVMTTDSGEQLDPNMLLSDHIDGEFLGEVTKSGTSFYFLENSSAEEVESINLFFSAASDENFESVGEEIEVEIPLNK